MKRCLKNIILIVSLMLVSCSPKQIPTHSTLLVRQNTVPIIIEPDSSLVSFTVDCDSFNNPIIRDYESISTKNVSTNLKQDSNKVKVLFKTQYDTVYIRTTDTIIKQQIPIITKPKRLKVYDKIVIYVIAIVIGIMIFKIIKI